MNHKKRHIVIIVGSPRSGFTVLKNCLGLLGLKIPAPGALDKADPDRNLSINSALLDELGVDPFSTENLPAGWSESGAANRARGSIKALLASGLRAGGTPVLGDAMMCRVMPLWLEVLEELDIEPKFIHLIRHPWEAARSLLEEEKIAIEKGHRLWLANYLAAEDLSKRHPHLAVAYDHIVADPILACRRIGRRLGLEYSADLHQAPPAGLVKMVRMDRKKFYASSMPPEEKNLYGLFEHLYNRGIKNINQYWDEQAGLEPRKRIIAGHFDQILAKMTNTWDFHQQFLSRKKEFQWLSESIPLNFGQYTYARRSHWDHFEGMDLKLFGQVVDPEEVDLKVYQDLLVCTFIERNVPPGARILDVGGGLSRILNFFSTSHECWNIDKLEGLGDGPKEEADVPGRLVRDYIGNFNPELPANYFDFVFSISALEHTPEDDQAVIDNIIDDINRVLKPGGFSLHAVDILFKKEGHVIHPFIHRVFERLKTCNSFIAPELVEDDPDLYCMNEKAYDKWWKPKTNLSYQDLGKPSSFNILWQKKAPVDTRVFIHSGLIEGAKTFWGAPMIIIPGEVVSSSIYSFGFFEPGLTAFILDYLKSGVTVIDVGAHLGFFSILAAELIGKRGRVIAFEPTPSTIELLSLNLKKYPQAEIVPKLAWSEQGSRNFKIFNATYSAYNTAVEDRLEQEVKESSNYRMITVEAVTLDQFCAERNLKPDLVKVDAESSELQVLQGMTKLLENDRPVVAVEVGDLAEKDSGAVPLSRELIIFVQNYGYKPLETLGGRIQEHHIHAGQYEYDNIILVPLERLPLRRPLGTVTVHNGRFY